MRAMKAFILGAWESGLSVTTSYQDERLMEWYDRGRNFGEKITNKEGKAMNEEQQYRVTFVGNYFTLTTFVSAVDEEQAIANATAFIQDQHGFDMEAEAFGAEAETQERV